MLDISIISVLMNNEDTLIKMKNSVLNQTFQQYEHIFCLSNKSSDNTIKLVKNFKSNKNLIFFESDNTKNKFDALNQAIKKSKGRYIILLHGDDYFIDDEVLNNIFISLKKYQNYSIYYADINYINIYQKVVREWKSPNEDKLKLSNIWKVAHTGLIIDKYKIDDDDLLYNTDYDISGDFLYLLNLIDKYPRQFKKINLISTNMLNTGDSSNLGNLKKQFIEDFIILKKYFSFIEVLLIIFLKKYSKILQYF